MKKLAVLFLIVALAVSFMVPAAAAGATYEAKKGTPVVDGKLDDIYKQSGNVTVSNDTNVIWKTGTPPTVSGTTYFLWDDKYVYFCTVVNDATPTNTADADGKIPSNWQGESVEHWLMFSGVQSKLSIDRFMKTNYTTKLGMFGDLKYAKHADGNWAVTSDDKGYTVELAIVNDGYKAGTEIKCSIQVNDFNDGTKNGVSVGEQKSVNTLKLIETAVELPKTPAKPATSDKTADLGVIVSAVAMAASALVVFKKKH